MSNNPFYGKWSRDDEPLDSRDKSAGWHGPMVSEQEEAVMLTDIKNEPVEHKKIRKAAGILAKEKKLNIENLSIYLEKKHPELVDSVSTKTLLKIISEFNY